MFLRSKVRTAFFYFFSLFVNMCALCQIFLYIKDFSKRAIEEKLKEKKEWDRRHEGGHKRQNGQKTTGEGEGKGK
jgi:hypothetical protein